EDFYNSISGDLWKFLIDRPTPDVMETTTLADRYEISSQLIRDRTSREEAVKLGQKVRPVKSRTEPRQKFPSEAVTSRTLDKPCNGDRFQLRQNREVYKARKNLSCSYCQKGGHVRNQCYQLERDRKYKYRE
ncbi:hypothetical protein OTU49_016861, partial [Cherax quadricarinatus]